MDQNPELDKEKLKQLLESDLRNFPMIAMVYNKDTGGPRLIAVKRPTCETCLYFLSEKNECRVDPPKIIRDKVGFACEFPPAGKDDWCGQHPEFDGWIEYMKDKKTKEFMNNISGIKYNQSIIDDPNIDKS